MSKTDLIFYTSLIAMEARQLQEVIVSTKPTTWVDWLIIGLGAVAGGAYALYDFLTGTKPVSR